MIPITYDATLVALSVVIAIFAAYTCFHLASRMGGGGEVARKGLLAGAAVTMGGGIWSMHFVGMLAVQLPISVSYDLLLTLISALTSILVTGIALVVASLEPLARLRVAAGGLLMGSGIAGMHYIGMAAMRADATMTYDGALVSLSVAIAVVASGVALWLAFNLRGVPLRMLAASVMGAAISGMHYTGMAAVSLTAAPDAASVTAPVLSQPLLASIIAVATFLIFGFTVLIAVPERTGAAARDDSDSRASTPASPGGDGPRLLKLPVQRNKTTLFIGLDDIVSIQADAHYTTVFTHTGRFFCPMSLTELEARLDPECFLRVHRSHMVNIRHAKAFERQKEHAVLVLDGTDDRVVPVSRGRVARLRHALGI